MAKHQGVGNAVSYHCCRKRRNFPVGRQSRHTAGRRTPSTVGGRGELRIIGGRWRGRRLSFHAAPGLRPTTDRVRETLFNWLMGDVLGARCADLFCGSGALGLEALSRGAEHCDFVDREPGAIRQLEQHLRTLEAEKAGQCHGGSAEAFVAAAAGPWDIVFVDPPFGAGLVQPSCDLLAQHDCLSAGACVYVETAREEPAPTVPPSWQLHREKHAGGVTSRLYRLD